MIESFFQIEFYFELNLVCSVSVVNLICCTTMIYFYPSLNQSVSSIQNKNNLRRCSTIIINNQNVSHNLLTNFWASSTTYVIGYRMLLALSGIFGYLLVIESAKTQISILKNESHLSPICRNHAKCKTGELPFSIYHIISELNFQFQITVMYLPLWLKVSISQKQISKFSLEPKNEWFYCISIVASKMC